MPTTMETAGQWLQQYGWSYETPDETLIITGVRGKSSTFRIFVQPADRWLLLAIVPFVPKPAPPCRDRFSHSLLRLNYEINLAKIGVDPDGDVSLCVELPAEGIGFDAFASALDALCFYADEYYLTLANLAQDPAYQPAQDLDIWSEAVQ